MSARTLARACYRASIGRVPPIDRLARRLLGAQQRPRTAKRPTDDRADSKSSDALIGCDKCRIKDSYRLQERIANKAIKCLHGDGVEMYYLPPTTTETRIGVIAEIPYDEIRAQLNTLATDDIEISETSSETNINLYEFNQDDIAPPATSMRLTLMPRPHCREGASFLKRRKVSLEMLVDGGGVAVVPRSGLGPRVLTVDRLNETRVDAVVGNHAVPQPPFPIDLVYTWVDSEDPHWIRLHSKYKDSGEGRETAEPTSASNAARWHSRDELLYSLRSVDMYAPFVRRIYVVTNGQHPRWLAEHERINLVTHEEIFPDGKALPTFNSHAIEACLHRIPGLSEHFIYLNDDFFFGTPVSWKAFFTPGGIGKIFPSPRHLDTRGYVEGDRATVAAHKKSRDLLYEVLNIRCEYKFKHAPYVLRRSTFDLLEQVYPDEFEATRHHRFRSIEDITPVSFMYNHFALHRGHSVVSKIGYAYVDVGAEDFAERLRELERSRPTVFCINDADSSDEDVDRNTGEFVAYLRARFPVSAPWESPSDSRARAASPLVDPSDKGALYSELTKLGPQSAIEEYRRLCGDGARAETVSKLLRALYLTGDFRELRRASDELVGEDRKLKLLRLSLLTKTDMSTRSVLEYAGFVDERAISKSLPWLGRTIEGRDDFDQYLAYIEHSPLVWGESPQATAWVANAARRGERLDMAVDLFERALVEVEIGSESPVHPSVFKPWVALDDFYDAAGDYWDSIFPDAGTLLGFFREGDFIGHDYDIDLGTRDAEAYARIRELLRTDWRFDVARGRTPDLLTQARHYSGVSLDILLQRWSSGSWEKRSHVYGWRFRDYDLEPLVVANRRFQAPVPTADYLAQMYGADWSEPQPGFDSRIEAPNCFFPDSDELVCTILNKLLAAYRVADLDLVEKLARFVKSETGYVAPRPRSSEHG